MSITEITEAKSRLDALIKKSRVHLYKPIQLAEILYEHRQHPVFDLGDVEQYRNPSKRWRDRVSLRLVGRSSTSSQKYQDNLFEDNAMPPEYIKVLGTENEASVHPGIIEAYIFNALRFRLTVLGTLREYLRNASTDTFKLEDFVGLFETEPGLKRSIDKVYEIVVYALFDTLVRHLEATVSVKIPDSKRSLLIEFEDFTRIVLGITASHREMTRPARLYRVGVTNAADRGLDMWANFGPAVQVKHVSLTQELAENITEQVAEHAKIIIVCNTADRGVVETIFAQVGLIDHIQGIATREDLVRWYGKCLDRNHAVTIGNDLLANLNIEFEAEFPTTGTALTDFMVERGYDDIGMAGMWQFPTGNREQSTLL